MKKCKISGPFLCGLLSYVINYPVQKICESWCSPEKCHSVLHGSSGKSGWVSRSKTSWTRWPGAGSGLEGKDMVHALLLLASQAGPERICGLKPSHKFLFAGSGLSLFWGGFWHFWWGLTEPCWPNYHLGIWPQLLGSQVPHPLWEAF